MMTLMLKLGEAAKELGMCAKTLMRHVRAGEISYIEIGLGKKRRSIRFATSDLTAFIDNHRRNDARPSRGKVARPSLRVYDFRARLKQTAKEPKP
jgi:hypothetical protein